jgi:hypothetical protein
MSQKTRIRPLPRKRLPYGKFRYSVEFWNGRDHYNKRRVSLSADRHTSHLINTMGALNQTLETNVKGKHRTEHSFTLWHEPVLERIWLENYSDLLIIKMLHPENIRRLYKVELFD